MKKYYNKQLKTTKKWQIFSHYCVSRKAIQKTFEYPMNTHAFVRTLIQALISAGVCAQMDVFRTSASSESVRLQNTQTANQ